MVKSHGRSSDSDAEVRRLLNLALSAPSELARMSVAELDLTLRAARRARLLGLLAVRLNDEVDRSFLPRAAIEQLESALAGADARARLARWELDRIKWALGDDEFFPVIVMKGSSYLLRDLPNAAGRSFADVDLMVAEDKIDVIESILTGRNWAGKALSTYDQKYYREWAHEIPPLVHAEREVEVDIHHTILPRTARLKPDAQKLLAEAQAIPGSRFHALSDTDTVLHAMTHLMFQSDLADSLRDLVDIDVLLRVFSESEDGFWSDLFDRAKELDLMRPAYYGVRYARMFLATPVPLEVWRRFEQEAPATGVLALMDRLVPRALYPQHPDRPSRATGFARFLLYIRLHWVTMPPLQLARHLAYKSLVRRGWLGKDEAQAA